MMTTTMSTDDDRCTTCQNTRLWHRENNPSHPFNDGSLPASATFGRRRKDGQGNAPAPDAIPQHSPWPFDPVLRQALMDKGVLVPQDLRDAEEKIRATTASLLPISGGTIITSGDMPPSAQVTGMHVVNTSTGGSYTVGGRNGEEPAT